MNEDPVVRLLLAIEKRARRPAGGFGLALIGFDLVAWLWSGEWQCMVYALGQAALFATVKPKEAPRG